MFTRRDILNIKPGSAAEAGRIFRDEVIPPLRGQKGMHHDDIFISPVLSEAVLNSYWDSQECADSYGRTTYPAALKALSKVLEGRPRNASLKSASPSRAISRPRSPPSTT